MMPVSAKIIVSGYVQGVGYRYYALDLATSLGIKGYVKNVAGGGVEVFAEGEKTAVEKLIEMLKQGPYMSTVIGVDVEYHKCEHRYRDFNITY